MITSEDYLTQHAPPGEAPLAVCAAAPILIQRVNTLLADPGCPSPDPGLRSGWRPPAFNAELRRRFEAGEPGGVNTAVHSEHMTGHAVDLDDVDGALDAWLTDDILTQYELYREAPSHTDTWCHLQDVPPHSGHRTFIP
jgi:hypothetical protein